MEKFVIIDGNSLINRAFYGLPMLKSLTGEPCNAVFGFVNMMVNLILNEKPEYLVCVFDAGKHTFRHDMYQAYKGTRDKMPEDLASQLPILKNLLKSMGIKTFEMPEIEADDLIGSLTRTFDKQFILISGDRDLLQLINNNTTVWLTQKGLSNVLKVDEEVLKKEFGLKPYQVIELKAIMGDSADNIPGVAGIGKVGAHQLIDEFDNLDNIYQNLDKVPNKYLSKLQNSRDMAFLSKQLATIKLDVKIDFGLDDCTYSLPFNDNVRKIMSDLDFKSLLSRKDLFSNSYVLEKQETNEYNVEKIEISSNAELDEMLHEMNDNIALSMDEMAMYFGVKNKEYILYTSGEIFTSNKGKITKILEGNIQKICFDAKDLMHRLSLFDIELNNYYDVSVATYISNQMDAEITLDDALKINNLTVNSKVCALFKLKEIYDKKLKESSQMSLFLDIELPLVKVLFNMEKDGIKIDVEQIKVLSEIYAKEIDDLTEKIYELAGEKFNINSPKQLQSILFEKLNIEYKGRQKGTSIEVLNSLQNKHEIINYIIRYRKVMKLKSTYLDGMLNYVDSQNKIHTTFMQKTTATGRLSSREPNLQNLPIRDDEGRVLRKMFSSSFENGSMISADYNQIELRLMANLSDDKNMVHDYLQGKDIHTATASKIFGVAEKDVTSNMRRVAKSVNFGIIYGISAFGLSANIGCSQKDASEFIKKYLEIYPRVKEYGDECINKAREKGYVSTIFGRTRYIPDINSANHNIRGFAERTAKNTPLQGSASDIIKIAMIKVNDRIKNENLKSKLVLQIHDELIVDCYPGESEKVKQILKDEMQSVVDLKVPLLVEVSEGKTLYDAK